MIVEQVNAEKLVSDWLRADPDVADIVGRRVVGKTPDSTATPWVRVQQLNATDGGRPDHLVEYLIQLDCYATDDGGQPEASALRRAVRRSLKQIQGAHATGVCSGAAIIGDGRIPDTDFEPARERWVITAQVWCHP